MQLPLGWNAVVIVAHPVLKLTMKDLLYYTSGFIQLFMIKWEFCSTSEWKGQLLVSEVLKSLYFPRWNSDKLCWYAIASSYKQHHINCAQWILRTGQLFLPLWNWNVTATVVNEDKVCYSKFFVLWLFLYSSSRPPCFWWHAWRCQKIERLQKLKLFAFLFGYFLSSKMSVVDWLHRFHLDMLI